ncbi:MAG: hypothetical protein HYS36_05095 [Candidatus Rokubacteria bacterium]|nr:hypothetical protein [Candidatus Rokubacteria bacterium]
MRCRPAGLALVLVIIVPVLFAPLAAEAQQAGKVSRIGYLSFDDPSCWEVTPALWWRAGHWLGALAAAQPVTNPPGAAIARVRRIMLAGSLAETAAEPPGE